VSDVSLTQADSAKERRNLRLRGSFAAGLISKVISVVATLVIVPLSLSYLGTAAYGMVATLTSLVAVLSFADLGIGNGLLNNLARTSAADDMQASRGYVSSALAMLCGVAAGLFAIWWLLSTVVDWTQLLNAGGAESADATVLVFVICFLLAIPLSIVDRVQLSLQEDYWNSVAVAAASLLGLVATAVIVHTSAGAPGVIAASLGALVVVKAVNAAALFGRRKPWLRPRVSAVNRHAVSALLRSGGLFFVLQAAAAVAFSTDNIVIARVLDARAVTTYAVPFRLFSIVVTTVALALTPLWPAYVDAIERNDTEWIRRMFRSAVIGMVALTVVTSATLLVAARPILSLWVGDQVHPSWGLLAGLAVWNVLFGLGAVISMLLNAAHVIKAQAALGALMALSNVLLSVVLVRWVGVAGAIWGTVLAYLVCSVGPSLFLAGGVLRRLPASSDATSTAPTK
jgi:O-antigen/teichoic acid export membrane protein